MKLFDDFINGFVHDIDVFLDAIYSLGHLRIDDFEIFR